MVGVTLDGRFDAAGTRLDSSAKAGDAVREREEVSAQHQHTDCGKLGYHGEASVEELPAAGLSSDRCTRDFASCYNKRLHSGRKPLPSIRVSTTYDQKRPREFALDWIIKHGDSIPPCGVTSNAGATDKKSSIQMKLLEHYVRYNRVHNVPQTQEKQPEVTDCSVSERDANRIRNMQHCRIFNDVDAAERSHKKQDLDPRTFSLADDATSKTVVRMDEECLSRAESTPSMTPAETEVTIIGGLRAVSNKDPE